MPKISDCESCLFCAHDSHLVCAVHPEGQNSNFCPDFQATPNLEPRKFIDFLGLLQQVESDRNCTEPFSNPFALNSDEEYWESEGATYYNGELILQPKQKTREEQLWLLDNHPLFTGVCPQCKYHFPQTNFHVVHFDCPSCGWVDDSV